MQAATCTFFVQAPDGLAADPATAHHEKPIKIFVFTFVIISFATACMIGIYISKAYRMHNRAKTTEKHELKQLPRSLPWDDFLSLVSKSLHLPAIDMVLDQKRMQVTSVEYLKDGDVLEVLPLKVSYGKGQNYAPSPHTHFRCTHTPSKLCSIVYCLHCSFTSGIHHCSATFVFVNA